MTDCPNTEIRDLLPDMLHETLPVHVRARVHEHLIECAACTDELELLSVVHALDPVPEFRRASAAAAAAAAVAVAVAPEKRGRWMSLPPLVRIAAAIALLAIGGASYRVVDNGIHRGIPEPESTIVRLLDSAPPPRLSEFAPNLLPAPGSALDEQAIMEILAEIEKMDGFLSVEPRILVHNPRISGDL